MNMNPGRHYDLRVRLPKRNGIPELCLLVPLQIAHTIESLLRSKSLHEWDSFTGMSQYLQSDSLKLSWDEPFLKLTEGDQALFGINYCGYRLEESSEVQYCFPMIGAKLHDCTFTIHLLLRCLNSFLASEILEDATPVATNRKQVIEINTVCNESSKGWGHATAGTLYGTFRQWLLSLTDEDKEIVCQKALVAMTRVSYAIRGLDKKQIARERKFPYDFRVGISSDGRFYLSCPGNACDLAMYPDGVNTSDLSDYSEFSCHNLDSALQQLTLLAGLASLLESFDAKIE